jgi:hypothetical protein
MKLLKNLKRQIKYNLPKDMPTANKWFGNSVADELSISICTTIFLSSLARQNAVHHL